MRTFLDHQIDLFELLATALTFWRICALGISNESNYGSCTECTLSSTMDAPLSRRRSRHLAGRLALVVLGVASTSPNNSGSSQQQQQQCAMTARIVPSAAAFVPPSSSTAAVSNHRTRILNRRTVPLVLKDPTDVGDLTTGSGDDGGGYPPENANNSAGPENSYAAPSTSPFGSDGINTSTPAVPLIELEDPEDYLNREFANNLILHGGEGDGFWNSGDGSAGAKPLEEEEEEEESTSSVPVPGGGDLGPYQAEHGAAERLFLETVVREGGNNIVRIEGIPPLGSLEEEEKEEALSVNDDRANASQSTPTTPTSTSAQYQIPTLPQIVKFALPATAIYLCDPLLSLIDTASVGLLAKSTAHQAALSPAIAVVNYSALLLAFLFVGATNFVAQAAARTKVGAGASSVGADVETNDKDNGKKDEKDTSSTDTGPAQILLSTLQISLHTGTLLGTLLFVLAPTLITLLSGNGSLPPPTYTGPPSGTFGSGPWDFPPPPYWGAPRRPAWASGIPPPPSSCWGPPPY